MRWYLMPVIARTDQSRMSINLLLAIFNIVGILLLQEIMRRVVFRDALGLIMPDPRHSTDEAREALIGVSERGRLVVVMFTERGDFVRIISARQATRQERTDYEEGNESS